MPDLRSILRACQEPQCPYPGERASVELFDDANRSRGVYCISCGRNRREWLERSHPRPHVVHARQEHLSQAADETAEERT